MTLSKSPVFGNYIHSEPKFIGAFPDRKDYPFNTGNYDIQVAGQHKQPETKPGVYIAECLNASFAKDPNVLPLPQGVRISTIAATHPVNIGTPETFKIGDRVRVISLNEHCATTEKYSKTLNQFGVIDSYVDGEARVYFSQFIYNAWYLGKQLKKEFAVGDYVINWEGANCVVDQYHVESNTYALTRYDGILCFCYGCDQLTYIPEEKKSGDDLTIKAGGTFTLNSGTFGPGPDTFKMNQPIFMDKQAENRLDRGTHSYSVKFLTAEDIYMSIKISTDPKSTLVKNWDEMNEVFEKCSGPQTTYSATIVLASGRVVNIPNPNKKDWTLKSTEKVTRIEPILLDHAEGNEDVDEFVLNSFVEHEEGLCWLKDMSRIIEQKDVVSPFETKFSYVTEIRKYVRKPLETPAYECTMPALRCLW